MAVVATWDAADASGIRNVSRYLFDVPTGAFTNPPLLSISFDASGNPDGDGTPPLPPGGIMGTILFKPHQACERGLFLDNRR